MAATSGSQSAASLELATGGEPVMAIGGFSGEGGNLTLAQFESYVKAGDIHYYIASGGNGGPGGGAGSSSSITSWVKAHYKAVTIGGQTLYDLTSPLSWPRRHRWERHESHRAGRHDRPPPPRHLHVTPGAPACHSLDR